MGDRAVAHGRRSDFRFMAAKAELFQGMAAHGQAICGDSKSGSRKRASVRTRRPHLHRAASGAATRRHMS
jgi:hypothetical protein